MQKLVALKLLGGSVAAAAEAIGVTSSAISQWPDVLTPRLVDRVEAALARKRTPKSHPVRRSELSPKESA